MAIFVEPNLSFSILLLLEQEKDRTELKLQKFETLEGR